MTNPMRATPRIVHQRLGDSSDVCGDGDVDASGVDASSSAPDALASVADGGAVVVVSDPASGDAVGAALTTVLPDESDDAVPGIGEFDDSGGAGAAPPRRGLPAGGDVGGVPGTVDCPLATAGLVVGLEVGAGAGVVVVVGWQPDVAGALGA